MNPPETLGQALSVYRSRLGSSFEQGPPRLVRRGSRRRWMCKRALPSEVQLLQPTYRPRGLTATAAGLPPSFRAAGPAAAGRRRVLTESAAQNSLTSRPRRKSARRAGGLEETDEGEASNDHESEGSCESVSQALKLGPRAARRMGKRANLGPRRGPTHLEGKSATPRAMDTYGRRVRIAPDFARNFELAASGAENVDRLPTHLTNPRYRDGEHSNSGVKLLAAWMVIFPDYGKYGTRLEAAGAWPHAEAPTLSQLWLAWCRRRCV
ncbi:unnamed protein product [Prorocentrum cordatum]|uniref:Uncharacterized protein n=1 Tax=Prorocentrum cordatum TaxID=2364126 RepID=A0ABN9V1N3_9DINO|nr:unnamed protein product [Polarella glacialis]